MDNSPCWDEPAGPRRARPRRLVPPRRPHHGDAADRPTDLDYGRYVRLAGDYRDHGYRDAGTEHSFVVEDPGFNALLILSEYALADIAQALGHDAESHRAQARRLTDALVDRLWDDDAGLFLCHDVRAGRAIEEKSVTGLLPLAVPGLPDGIARTLLRTAAGEHFGLGSTTALTPSYDLRGHAFDPSRYWRGPAWFNINWVLERGLRHYGTADCADTLRQSVLAAGAESGFAEYVDPYTGQARGTTDFSWTAAVVLDLLADVHRGGGTR